MVLFDMEPFNKAISTYHLLVAFVSVGKWSVVTLREKVVDIVLGVPVFVTVAGVAEEDVVAEAFQIAIFYAEESHQCFVVIDAGVIFCGKGKSLDFLDEIEKHCVELCVMLRIVCVSHSDLSEGVENGRQHLPQRRNNCHSC